MQRSILLLATLLLGSTSAFARQQVGSLYYSEEAARKDDTRLIYHEPKPEAAPKVEVTSEQPTPALEFALDRVSKATQAARSGGISHWFSGSSCADCVASQASIRFQQCSSKNDYLENEIAKQIHNNGFIGRLAKTESSINSIIKPACIRMGMESKFGAQSKSFRSCGPGQNQAAKATLRPCITENYFNLISNSFDVAAKCMKNYINDGSEENQRLDVRAVYALINIESGFHVNAMSPTGAGGIGQFTQAAIDSVNRNEFSKMRKHLQSSNDPICQQVADQVLNSPMRGRVANNCDRISISKGNPLTNMLYTFSYLKLSKKQLQNSIFENSAYKDKFQVSQNDQEKIERALMVWSHNTGPAGTWTPAKALLNSVYKNKPVTNAEKFIQEMQFAMQKFPASANRSKARRAETARYFPAITATLKNIEDGVGGGSCVNF